MNPTSLRTALPSFSPPASAPQFPLAILLEALFNSAEPAMKRGEDPDYTNEVKKRGRPPPQKKSKVDTKSPSLTPRRVPLEQTPSEPWSDQPFLVHAASAVLEKLSEVSCISYSLLTSASTDGAELAKLEKARTKEHWANREEIDEFLQSIDLLYAREARRLHKALEFVMELKYEAHVARELLKLRENLEEDSVLSSVIHASQIMLEKGAFSRANVPSEEIPSTQDAEQ